MTSDNREHFTDRLDKARIFHGKVRANIASGASTCNSRDLRKAEIEVRNCTRALERFDRRQADQVEEDEFRKRLEAEYGTADNPKAQRLWEIAWDHGHASGLAEVEGWYGELVELVQ